VDVGRDHRRCATVDFDAKQWSDVRGGSARPQRFGKHSFLKDYSDNQAEKPGENFRMADSCGTHINTTTFSPSFITDYPEQ
jgi:hypothetical protein